MNPGELRHKIKIQLQTTRQNEYGEVLDIYETETLNNSVLPLNYDPLTWEGNYKEVWASINPIVGKEYFSAETVNSEVTHKIRIRYITGIKPAMRIEFNGREFEIESVINYKELNKELQLMCKELI